MQEPRALSPAVDPVSRVQQQRAVQQTPEPDLQALLQPEYVKKDSYDSKSDDLDLDYSLHDRRGSNMRATSSTRTDEDGGNGTGSRTGRRTRQAVGKSSVRDSSRDGSLSRSSSSNRSRSRPTGSATRSSRQQEQQTASQQSSIHAPLLTQFLNKCSSLEELHALFFRHHHRFNHIHVACALNRLAWLKVCVCVIASSCVCSQITSTCLGNTGLS